MFFKCNNETSNFGKENLALFMVKSAMVTLVYFRVAGKIKLVKTGKWAPKIVRCLSYFNQGEHSGRYQLPFIPFLRCYFNNNIDQSLAIATAWKIDFFIGLIMLQKENSRRQYQFVCPPEQRRRNLLCLSAHGVNNKIRLKTKQKPHSNQWTLHKQMKNFRSRAPLNLVQNF